MIWFFVSMYGWLGVIFARRSYWYGFFLFLFLASAFRYYVGSDFDDYVFLFEGAAAGSDIPVELSYSLIARALATAGFNFQAQILFYSFFTFFFLYRGIIAVSDDRVFVGVMVFFIYLVFYFPSLSIMRQALAASIAFYACYRYLHQGYLVSFVGFVLLSTCFHMGGLLYLLCIPMYYFRPMKVVYVALIGLAAILGVTVFVDILHFVSGVIGFTYKGYAFKSMPIKAPIFYIFTMMLIAVFLYALSIARKGDYFLLNVILFIIIARLLAIDYKPFNRLGAGFAIFIPLFVYQVFYLKFKEHSRVAILVLVAPLLFISDYFRANKDYSYYQYSINVCIYGVPCPLSIFGDTPLEDLKIREELR